MWYKNIAGRFFGLVTKHACDGRTDRRTDGRTELRLPRPRMRCSRGNNVGLCVIFASFYAISTAQEP